MIAKLKLRNFQKHRSEPLAFAPGITTITGRTDSGKSALLRALRWVFLNDKPNASFIRRGAKFAKVTALVNGVAVTRLQRPGRNEYRMAGKVFKSFGTGVPDPIRDALALSEINFQGQHEPTFWFSLSPGEVSRRLNAVIDLSVIDEALQKVAASVRSASERKRLSEENALRVKEEAAQLADQRGRANEFKKLQEAYETIETLGDHIRDLSEISERIRANRDSKAGERAIEGSTLLQMGARAVALGIEVTALERALSYLRVADEEGDKAVRAELDARQMFQTETRGKNCPICMRPLP